MIAELSGSDAESPVSSHLGMSLVWLAVHELL